MSLCSQKFGYDAFELGRVFDFGPMTDVLIVAICAPGIAFL